MAWLDHLASKLEHDPALRRHIEAATMRHTCGFSKTRKTVVRSVRFRTLGCWPVTGAIPSHAVDKRGAVPEISASLTSERQERINDGDEGGSLERKKQEGYF